MKVYCAILLCFIHVTSGFIWDNINNFWLYRPRKDVPGVPDPKATCVVSEFDLFQNLNLHKLDGIWYEVFRTQTSIPYFNGMWKFQSNSTELSSSSFLFSAKGRDKMCLSPVSGTAKLDGNNTILLTYKGPKGRTEEEYRVIFTDYDHRTLLYSCQHLRSNGECSSEASSLIILARNPKLLQSALDHMKGESKKVCIESDTLVQQNGAEMCSLDTEDYKSWTKTNDDIVCQEISSCGLACPSCCREQEDGCIRCQCEETEQDWKAVDVQSERKRHKQNEDIKDECVYALSDCPSNDCLLLEKRPGCQVCNCKMALRAPETNERIWPIQDVRECATSCRTATVNGILLCNCSNIDVCEPIPENVPYPCSDKEERYYYDKRTDTCHAFYGSCLPDRNNFRTLDECITTCVDVCLLPLQSGFCDKNQKAPVNRYYFNRNRGVCAMFSYGGCKSNANNFLTKELCEHQCPAWMDRPTTNRRPDRCYLGNERGSCQESHIRYFYLNVTRTCTSFIYSGCGKNDNNFESLQECRLVCRENIEEETQPTCPSTTNCRCRAVLKDGDLCAVCPDECVNSGMHSRFCISLAVVLMFFRSMASRNFF